MDTTKDFDVGVRLAAIEAQLAYLVERQKKTEELFAEMTPIARAAMATTTAKLDALDKKGYFAFARELARVGERVLEGFAPEDVRRLGDAVVGILQTVRAVTQPNVLHVADEAAVALEKADTAEPIGIFGAMRATHDDDVRKGIAVTMELMRHLGRAARAVTRSPEEEDRKAKLAAALGPRRKREAEPVKREPAKPPTTAPTRIADETALVSDWNERTAAATATSLGIALDDARLAVVRAARTEFEKSGASPNIRKLTQLAGLATKDLYALFPKAPARTVAKIAGIPKPAGCI